MHYHGYRGHFACLSNFKSLFISSVIAKWDLVRDFNRTGLSRLKIRQKRLIQLKMLIYYMLCVTAPSFLFGIGITTAGQFIRAIALAFL